VAPCACKRTGRPGITPARVQAAGEGAVRRGVRVERSSPSSWLPRYAYRRQPRQPSTRRHVRREGAESVRGSGGDGRAEERSACPRPQAGRQPNPSRRKCREQGNAALSAPRGAAWCFSLLLLLPGFTKGRQPSPAGRWQHGRYYKPRRCCQRTSRSAIACACVVRLTACLMLPVCAGCMRWSRCLACLRRD